MKKKLILAGLLAISAVLCIGSVPVQAAPALTESAEAMHQAGGVKEVSHSGEKMDIRYPQVTAGPLLYRARVNSAIETEVRRFVKAIQAERAQGADVSAWVSWQEGAVPAWQGGDGELTSFILVETHYYDRAAHPTAQVKGFVFKPDGTKLTLADAAALFPGLTPASFSQEILRQSEGNDILLYPDFKGIQTFPREFYVGQDGKLYFIFQQYEIAPYAAGWRAIAAGTVPEEADFSSAKK